MISLQTAVICDAATVREGLLHVLGGGISVLNRESFPAPFSAALALVFEVNNVEPSGEVHEVKVEARRVGFDEEAFFGVSVTVSANVVPGPGTYQLIPLAMDLRNAGIPEQGEYEIVVLVDGATVTTLHFLAALASFSEQDMSNPFG